MKARTFSAFAIVGMMVTLVATSDGLRVSAQTPRIVWIDALCGADPVARHLHERLNNFAKDRQWETRTLSGGCQWVGDKVSPAALEAALERDAQMIRAAMVPAPKDATVVVLGNSMVAARMGDLRPAVLNPKLLAREVYLFSTDPDVLCRRTPIRVGYLRGTARPIEIVGTLAFESGRAPSAIDIREVGGIPDFAALLEAKGDKSIDLAAIVADDVGGTYGEFKTSVIDRRGGVVKPVSLCSGAGLQAPVRLERRLDGSVSYLKVVAPPDTSAKPDLALLALVRPGQEPAVVPPKGMWARFADSVSSRTAAEEPRVRASDFRDFPVLLAIGPSERELADDPALKQTLSHCYFEGMYDSLAGKLSPCQERADMLFGVYLLSSYLEDSTSAYKGCALQAYYQLMASTPNRPGTAEKNMDILSKRPNLAACLSSAPAPSLAVKAAGSGGATVPCVPGKKENFEAQDYGKHYAFYREGMKAIATAMNASGAAKEESFRLAESCLVQGLQMSQERRCDKFSQGLFVVPYEPSLPLGIVRLKSSGK